MYDAVLLCTGATWPRDIPIVGRHLGGIHFAVKFLEHWQEYQTGYKRVLNAELMAEGKNVIIIGGGDTGCDCIATSLRQVGLLP
jgi:glutamate synthase (NADPH/NADH)